MADTLLLEDIRLLKSVSSQLGELIHRGEKNLDSAYESFNNIFISVFADYYQPKRQIVKEIREAFEKNKIETLKDCLDKCIEAFTPKEEPVKSEDPLILFPREKLPDEYKSLANQCEDFLPVKILDNVGSQHSLVKVQAGILKDTEIVVFNKFLK